uniref:Transmembrane protein 273 n=1 Tax=Rattus norvegicus TaxID=10116 RepID=A0ABK0LBF8_RAT
MSSGVPLLKALLLLLAGTGRAQVLATGKSAGTEIDFKYVVIGTALGVALSAGFLALKICMIRRHLSDNDSTDLKNTPQGAILLKEKSLSLHGISGEYGKIAWLNGHSNCMAASNMSCSLSSRPRLGSLIPVL